MRKMFIATALVALVALVAAPAIAGGNGRGKPGGGSGKPSSGGGSLSLVLVVDNNGNGAPNHGDTVTFGVSTTVERPFVSVHCYQGGVLVLGASAGFYEGYPWSRTFGLWTSTWTSGGADCTAQLYTTRDGSRITTLATLGFAVAE